MDFILAECSVVCSFPPTQQRACRKQSMNIAQHPGACDWWVGYLPFPAPRVFRFADVSTRRGARARARAQDVSYQRPTTRSATAVAPLCRFAAAPTIKRSAVGSCSEWALK